MISSYSLQDEINLQPFRKEFDKYSWKGLRADLISGLSVAMLTLPQSLAYALVAGLPVCTGLYASIFSALVVALFGSSRHLIVGPSNAIAILVQEGLSSILFTYYRDVVGVEREIVTIQLLTQLLVLVGIIQIIAALLKLGRLTHFVSHTVIIGYLSGVTLALCINQLFPLLGITVPPHVSSLYERGKFIIIHLKTIHGATAIIGISCFCFLLLLKRMHHKLPSGAVMLVTVSTGAYLATLAFQYVQHHYPDVYDWSRLEALVEGVRVVGETHDGEGFIPTLGWPAFNGSIVNRLLPVAFAIALLSVMEASSTAKSIAARSGQRLSTNQEIFALGMGNLFSSLMGALPVSGSPSRTALNYESGAHTRLAAVFNSLFVYLILFACSFLIRHIPVAAFAALLLVSAGHIINFKQLFLCLKATSSDALVLCLTLLSCIFLSLDIAFYIGVALSITLHLQKAAVPQLVEFTLDEEGMLQRLDPHQPTAPRKIRLIKVEGELFFGAADLFQSTLKSITEDDTTTQVIILQLKNARDIDATACLALQQLYEYLKSSGRHLIACGITHPVWDVLSDSGLVELIGKENLFIFDERHPYLSVQRAFSRATTLNASCLATHSTQEESLALTHLSSLVTEKVAS